MSAGTFDVVSYEANSGKFFAIKVQPETLAANIGGVNAGAGTAADPTLGSVRVTGSPRAIGIKARSVRVRFTATPPSGYAENQSFTVPILTPARWNTISKGSTGTYLGVAVVVRSKTDESIV